MTPDRALSLAVTLAASLPSNTPKSRGQREQIAEVLATLEAEVRRLRAVLEP